MDQDWNYMEERKTTRKQGIIVLVVLTFAVVLCVMFMLSDRAKENYSSTTTSFLISNIEEHSSIFETYYTANISNGYCEGEMWLSEEAAEQVEEGDLVKTLVITNDSVGLSVATVNLNYGEDVYNSLYNRLKNYTFEYISAEDVEINISGSQVV